jgi:hypothetical protein
MTDENPTKEDWKEYEDELFEKEINQLEKVEPVVSALKDMGTLWKEITTKLSEDGICYITGKSITKDSKFDIVRVPNNKLPKGMIAYVSVLSEENN